MIYLFTLQNGFYAGDIYIKSGENGTIYNVNAKTKLNLVFSFSDISYKIDRHFNESDLLSITILSFDSLDRIIIDNDLLCEKDLYDLVEKHTMEKILSKI